MLPIEDIRDTWWQSRWQMHARNLWDTKCMESPKEGINELLGASHDNEIQKTLTMSRFDIQKIDFHAHVKFVLE